MKRRKKGMHSGQMREKKQLWKKDDVLENASEKCARRCQRKMGDNMEKESASEKIVKGEERQSR